VSGVDVLAVMKRLHQQSASHPNGSVSLESESSKAISAVSELVEAAQEMNALAKGPDGGVSQADKRSIILRMNAALARCGVAP
jgi:hypothetical protein